MQIAEGVNHHSCVPDTLTVRDSGDIDRLRPLGRNAAAKQQDASADSRGAEERCSRFHDTDLTGIVGNARHRSRSLVLKTQPAGERAQETLEQALDRSFRPSAGTQLQVYQHQSNDGQRQPYDAHPAQMLLPDQPAQNRDERDLPGG
jgi:hypothetical protein